MPFAIVNPLKLFLGLSIIILTSSMDLILSITACTYKITIKIIDVHAEGMPATSADIHE